MNENTLIHIFKPGTHTAMSGTSISFSESELQASAAAYDPAIHEAPLVVGHPVTDAPAYGWVKSLSYSEGLHAEPQQVEPQFSEMFTAGRFKKVSASFYTPDSVNNPVPGVYYLKHVGFLGAQPPAIKGLKQFAFSEVEDGVISFDEFDLENFLEVPEPTKPASGDTMSEEDKARLAALEAENAELKQKQAAFAEVEELRVKAEKVKAAEAIDADNKAFAESLIKEGRLLPAQAGAVVATLNYVANSVGDLEFSEGDVKKPLLSGLKDVLKTIPKAIEFGEQFGETGRKNEGLSDLQIALKARAYQTNMASSGVNISFTEAVDSINSGLTLESK